MTPSEAIQGHGRAGEPLFDEDEVGIILKRLDEAGYALIPIEPTDAMKLAAFGPIMLGGRGGPITADLLRQEVGLGTFRKMVEAGRPIR